MIKDGVVVASNVLTVTALNIRLVCGNNNSDFDVQVSNFAWDVRNDMIAGRIIKNKTTASNHTMTKGKERKDKERGKKMKERKKHQRKKERKDEQTNIEEKESKKHQ